MTVRYDKATDCERSPAFEAAVACIAQWALRAHLGNLGICNCRSQRGGSSRSIHSQCRAGDLACNAFDAIHKALGDAYAEWLILHSEELQVQLIIWNGRVWSSVRADEGWRPYNGASDHTNHLHIEWNHDARDHELYDTDPFEQTPGGFMAGLTDEEQREVLQRVRDSNVIESELRALGFGGETRGMTFTHDRSLRGLLDRECVTLPEVQQEFVNQDTRLGTVLAVLIAEVRKAAGGDIDVDALAERLAPAVGETVAKDFAARLAE